MGQQQERIKRALTVGEINLARSVFGRSVFYEKVYVHCDSYLPFGLQASRTAMAPNGEIWFRQALYKADFSTAAAGFQHVFIHEMSHVWQHQKGMWVRIRGLLSWAAEYKYRLDGKQLLHNYSMEQQASIIADYWFLKKYGYTIWLGAINNGVNFQGVTDKTIARKYGYALSQFFKQR